MSLRDRVIFLFNILLALLFILLITGGVVRTAIYFNVLPAPANPLDRAD